MPGLIGVFGSITRNNKSIELMFEAMTHCVDYTCDTITGTTYSAAVLHHGHYIHSVSSRSSDVEVLVDGWLLSLDGKPLGGSGLTKIIEAYRKNDFAFLLSMNGQFNMVLVDHASDQLHLITDRGGTRQLFYLYDGNDLFFAPEGKAVLAGAGRKPQLNERQVYNMLSFGRIWLDSDTFFMDIHAVPPASILTWSNGRLSTRSYWKWQYSPSDAPEAELRQQGIDTLRTVVDDLAQQPANGVSLTLSGGLDSRLILAAMSPEQRNKTMCFTIGAGPDHDEVTVARKVAETLGSPWHLIQVDPSDFVRCAKEGIQIIEGLDLLTQSYGLTAFRSIKEQASVFLNGLLFDVTLGGCYCSPEIIDDPFNHELGRQFAVKRYCYFTRDEFRSLSSSPDPDDIWDTQMQRLLAIYDASSNERSPDRIDEIVYRNRFWRYLFVRQYWLRLFFDEITPAYDTRMLDYILSIPCHFRRDYEFFRRFLMELDPQAAGLQYVNTTLPANAPLEFWDKAKRLEAQREQLYRDIYRVSSGKLFIPYTHYYSNFDEWMRLHPLWKELVHELLLSDNSILCDKYLRRDRIAEMVTNHETARQSNFAKIIQFMTLEQTLRTWFT